MKKILNLILSRFVITVLLVLLQLVFLIFEILRLQHYYILFSVISMILSWIVVIYLLCKPYNPSIKLAWIVPILAFPLLGGLIYILYGHLVIPKKLKKNMERVNSDSRPYQVSDQDNRKQMTEVEQSVGELFYYAEKYAGAAVYTNSGTEYFNDGEAYWKSLLNDLKKAEKFIFLEYFIISKGSMWDAIHEILKEKTAQGVEVRVIYDDIGSIFTLPGHYAKKLEREGIKCIPFNQIFPMMATILNYRDHRKIAVIDGRIAYTGGINISDEYINYIQKYGRWKDAGVRMEGDAVRGFTLMFLQIWNTCNYNKTDYEQFIRQSSLYPVGEGYVQPYGTNPLQEEVIGENIYIQIINRAHQYVYIYTPYLIVGHEMIVALQLAAKRGIDVRIVTPGIPDKKPVYRLTQSYYKELIQAGVHILQYKPGFLHAKCFLCDDDLAAIGTINMDYRSFYHHFECGAILYNTRAGRQLKEDMLSTFGQCEEITEAWCNKKFRKSSILDSLLKLFAPLM